MKKLLVICFCLASASCFSQGLFTRLHFGLKAGANYSNYTNADFKTDALAGFHAGAIVNFKLIGGLSIQEEFLFSSQGAKIKDDVLGKENITVYYMSVPFLLKYQSPMGLYIEAGPQVGGKIKEDLDGAAINSFAKKLDLAFAGGIGYRSRIGLGIGARYIAGLSKVGDFNYSGIKTDFKTNVIQASVFYMF